MMMMMMMMMIIETVEDLEFFFRIQRELHDYLHNFLIFCLTEINGLIDLVVSSVIDTSAVF